MHWWLKQQTRISHSSKGWKVWDRATGRVSVYWGPTSWFTDDCVLTGQETEKALWSLFHRALIPFMKAPPSWPNPITLGIDFNLGIVREAQALSVTINARFMNTPGTYLAGGFAFTCNWIISWGCWGIPYEKGNTPCFRALFPVGRSEDSSWCLSPPFETTDVWTVRITEVSFLGPVSTLLAPCRGLCSEPGAPVAAWAHLESWLTEGPVFCPPALSCFTCHELAAHEWRKGIHLEWKMWFSWGGFLIPGGRDGLRADSPLSPQAACEGKVQMCSVSGIWPWIDPSHHQIQC